MFDILSSKKIFHANNIQIYENRIKRSLPYVVRTTQNNGIRGYIIEDIKYANDKNTLSFAQDTFSVFYQKENYFTGNKVKILKPKFAKPNELIMKYITASMQKALSRLYWGVGSTVESISNTKISLPIKNGNIDFDFMEEFIKELENAKLKKVKEYLKENNLDNPTLTKAEKEALEKFENNQIEWGEFEYSVFFKLCKIKNKLTKSNLNKKGKYPVFSSESENNGIIGYTNLKPDFLIDAKNKFYIIFGDHSRNFNISKQNFCVADNVKVLSLKKIFSIEILKFIISSWKRSIPNKGYSRHWSLAKNTKISLPIKNEKIDFDFMENFIKGIEKTIIKNLNFFYYSDKS